MNPLEKYEPLIGTEQKFSGPVFSYDPKKEIKTPTAFTVLSVRPGTAMVMNMTTMQPEYGTVQFLLKRKGMKRAQWCKPMPNPYNKIEEED